MKKVTTNPLVRLIVDDSGNKAYRKVFLYAEREDIDGNNVLVKEGEAYMEKQPTEVKHVVSADEHWIEKTVAEVKAYPDKGKDVLRRNLLLLES